MPIHYDLGDDHVALITIDRPEAKNSLDLYHFRDLANAELRYAQARVALNDDGQSLVISSQGRSLLTPARPRIQRIAPPSRRNRNCRFLCGIVLPERLAT